VTEEAKPDTTVAAVASSGEQPTETIEESLRNIGEAFAEAATAIRDGLTLEAVAPALAILQTAITKLLEVNERQLEQKKAVANG
jgi:hypothetical protein